mgnify:CR=1 FL=1
MFSTIFKSDVPNFAAYLIIGTVMFNFFNEACGMALGSIVGNASLITKVYMPKYIYPLTRVMSSSAVSRRSSGIWYSPSMGASAVSVVSPPS